MNAGGCDEDDAAGALQPSLNRWIPTPKRGIMLFVGLWLFGVGESMILTARLGNSPWTVLSQGIGEIAGLSIGVVTIIVGALVLVVWIPLKQRPGLGTIANVVVVGVAIDVVLATLPHVDSLVARVSLMLGGIAVVGLGSGLYLGAGMGPGPRDGLMTGLHRRFGWSIAACRCVIETLVLVAGYSMGGLVGIGTVLFALLVGPAVGVAVRALSLVPSGDL